jgi:acetyl-CoA acetyltransferase/uncharacterized OB-fold protein
MIDGWLIAGQEPALVGLRCRSCGTYAFPPVVESCPNPACGSEHLELVELSRRGRVWSYTDARYQPPPPYVSPSDPYEPFAIAAVELPAERMIVLGQLAAGFGVEDLAVGDEVELVVETLDNDANVWRWRPLGAEHATREALTPATASLQPPAPTPHPAAGSVAVLGVGMHPWGKWGRPFSSYGVAAARASLIDAGVDWRDVDFVAAGETVRCGYAGYVAASTLARALGWNGARLATCYAACASGAAALEAARTRILAGLSDVALVVGADTTPKGFLAPAAGERWDDPDWLRFRLIGATNPAYFGLYARRRMALYGSVPADFAAVKEKNSRHGLDNPNARYRKKTTVEEVLASPVVADPLHLLDICATSDGAAAIVLGSDAAARRFGLRSRAVRIASVATVSPRFPNVMVDLPDIATDSAAAAAPPEVPYRASIAAAAYEESGVGPKDLSLAEVYDLSSAMELDWYEDIGLCGPGEAEKLLHSGDTTLGGRVPVNPSGGLACFGEAVPAQALAQICELTWQLRGEAGLRQVEGAQVALAVNQGLFGHGSSAILLR